jgi:hypothetical protein
MLAQTPAWRNLINGLARRPGRSIEPAALHGIFEIRESVDQVVLTMSLTSAGRSLLSPPPAFTASMMKRTAS